jgi:hypothetical protein
VLDELASSYSQPFYDTSKRAACYQSRCNAATAEVYNSEVKTRPLLTAALHNPRADLLRSLMLLTGSLKMIVGQRVALMKPLNATEVLQGVRRRRQNRAEMGRAKELRHR